MPVFGWNITHDTTLPATPGSVSWVYEVYYTPKERRSIIDQYRMLMRSHTTGLPAGVPKAGLKMSFFHNMDDALEHGGWSEDQLHKHFVIEEERMAFATGW